MGKIIKPTLKSIKDLEKTGGMIAFWDDQFASDYELDDISKDTKSIIKSLIPKTKKGVCLDNGCGTGRIKEFIEGMGWQVIGADVSRNALLRAAEKSPLNLLQCPAHKLPFKDNYFDLIISWRVLHNIHKDERLQALKEICRVLKKGAKFICSVQANTGMSYDEYSTIGIGHPKDKDAYYVSMRAGNKTLTAFKKQYSTEDINYEFNGVAELKIHKIKLLKELSGMNAKKGQYNTYWVIEYTKE